MDAIVSELHDAIKTWQPKRLVTIDTMKNAACRMEFATLIATLSGAINGWLLYPVDLKGHIILIWHNSLQVDL